MRSFGELVRLYLQSMATGELTGESPLTDLPHVGAYLSSQMGRYVRGVEHDGDAGSEVTLARFMACILGHPRTRESVAGHLTFALQNKRAGRVIEIRNSPIQRDTGEQGRTVVADFNLAAYLSVRALLKALSMRTPRQLRQAGFAERVPRRCVPPESPPVSDGGRHCLAHYRKRRECEAARRHCRWAQGTMCLPRSPRTRSVAGIGANVAGIGAAGRRRAAPKVAQGGLVDPPGSPAVSAGPARAGWRVPRRAGMPRAVAPGA